MTNKAIYKKAAAEVVLFGNTDMVSTSGACGGHANQNNYGCYYGLSEVGSGGPGAPLD